MISLIFTNCVHCEHNLCFHPVRLHFREDHCVDNPVNIERFIPVPGLDVFNHRLRRINRIEVRALEVFRQLQGEDLVSPRDIPESRRSKASGRR